MCPLDGDFDERPQSDRRQIPVQRGLTHGFTSPHGRLYLSLLIRRRLRVVFFATVVRRRYGDARCAQPCRRAIALNGIPGLHRRRSWLASLHTAAFPTFACVFVRRSTVCGFFSGGKVDRNQRDTRPLGTLFRSPSAGWEADWCGWELLRRRPATCRVTAWPTGIGRLLSSPSGGAIPRLHRSTAIPRCGIKAIADVLWAPVVRSSAVRHSLRKDGAVISGSACWPTCPDFPWLRSTAARRLHVTPCRCGR
jgi:hypothetical protein